MFVILLFSSSAPLFVSCRDRTIERGHGSWIFWVRKLDELSFLNLKIVVVPIGYTFQGNKHLRFAEYPISKMEALNCFCQPRGF